MSYDLTLFRIPGGADPSLAYQQLMEQQETDSADWDAWKKRPLPDAVRSEMQRIADALTSWRPAIEQFQPESPLPWIELNDHDLQVQFHIHDGTVAVTIPYFRDRALERLECATGSIEILRAAAGYSAFDPQFDRVVTSADLKEMVSRYRGMDRVLPELVAQSDSQSARKRPWWKIW